MKKCSQCHQEKPLTEFRECRAQCKDCRKQYMKRWREANPDKVRARYLRQFPKQRERQRLERERKQQERFRLSREYKAGLPLELQDAEYVPLTQGKFMAVPPETFHAFMQHKWLLRKGKYGYRIPKLGGEGIHAHHEVFRILGLPIPQPQVDHIDGDGLNNRLENLRAATNQQNSWNKAESLSKGVRRERGRWRAFIFVSDREINLGLYGTRQHARGIRELARAWLHGEFAPGVPPQIAVLQELESPDLSTLEARAHFRKLLQAFYRMLNPERRAA